MALNFRGCCSCSKHANVLILSSWLEGLSHLERDRRRIFDITVWFGSRFFDLRGVPAFVGYSLFKAGAFSWK